MSLQISPIASLDCMVIYAKQKIGPSTYANTNSALTDRKPLPTGRLKTCTEILVVNRFRENWRLRARISVKVGWRGQQVETKNPTERGARRGYRPV